MKKLAFGLSILCLVGYAGFAAAANPACSAVAISTITAPTTSNITGNTCGNNVTAASNIANVCSNLTGLDGVGADVYGLTIGASYSNVTISVTPPNSDWFPAIFVMPSSANGCGGTGQACKVSAQASSAVEIQGTLPTGLAAGTYYIVVSDTNGSGADAGCGAYNMAVSGSLPVKLQKFSVQ